MTRKCIRVLIVEDSEATAYLIKKAFSDRRAKVEWELCFATDGEELLWTVFSVEATTLKLPAGFHPAGLEPSQAQWQGNPPDTQERREVEDSSRAGFFGITRG